MHIFTLCSRSGAILYHPPHQAQGCGEKDRGRLLLRRAHAHRAAAGGPRLDQIMDLVPMDLKATGSVVVRKPAAVRQVATSEQLQQQLLPDSTSCCEADISDSTEGTKGKAAVSDIGKSAGGGGAAPARPSPESLQSGENSSSPPSETHTTEEGKSSNDASFNAITTKLETITSTMTVNDNEGKYTILSDIVTQESFEKSHVLLHPLRNRADRVIT